MERRSVRWAGFTSWLRGSVAGERGHHLLRGKRKTVGGDDVGEGVGTLGRERSGVPFEPTKKGPRLTVLPTNYRRERD